MRMKEEGYFEMNTKRRAFDVRGKSGRIE